MPVIASLAALALSLPAPMEPLPENFNGVWDRTKADCTDEDGVTRLVIDTDGLSFYEWGGRIISMRGRNGGAISIDMDWWDTSDVDVDDQPVIRRRSALLFMSPDRNALELTLETEQTQYVRCQGAD